MFEVSMYHKGELYHHAPSMADIPDDSRFECTICYERKHPSGGFLLFCTHRFCWDCLRMHVRQWNPSPFNRATCPYCRAILTDHDIRSVFNHNWGTIENPIILGDEESEADRYNENDNDEHNIEDNHGEESEDDSDNDNDEHNDEASYGTNINMDEFQEVNINGRIMLREL